MQSDQHCPKCGSSMEEGFLFDRSHDSFGQPEFWVEGAPQKSFWWGTRFRDKGHYEIRSYRCTRCGYLESYATEETKK
jgi:hypothetical protein